MTGPMMRYRVMSLLIGAAAAAVTWALLMSAMWVHDRWIEFEIMRADIVYIHPQIEAARRREAPTPTPPPSQPSTRGATGSTPAP